MSKEHNHFGAIHSNGPFGGRPQHTSGRGWISLSRTSSIQPHGRRRLSYSCHATAVMTAVLMTIVLMLVRDASGLPVANPFEWMVTFSTRISLRLLESVPWA